MAQVSGTFPALTVKMRAMHAKRNTKRLPTARGAAPTARVPGGLHTHRALAHAKTRKGC